MTDQLSTIDSSSSQRRLHVLMCAAACHPDLGSEFAIGWQWATAAARHHRVTVVAGDAHGAAEAIQKRLDQDSELRQNLSVRAIPWFDPPRSRMLERLWVAVPPIYYWHYRRWMRQAAEEMRLVVVEESVDVIHQVTFASYREPGRAWALGHPFVWGPVGGTQDVPWPFLPSLGLYDGCRHAARNLLNRWDLHWRSDVAQAMRASAGLSAVASDTRDEINRVFGRSSVVIPATACGYGIPAERATRSNEPVRFVFSGLHIARKGLPFALDALGRLTDLPWFFDVLGSGPLTERWKRHAERLGIADRVRFHGFLPRAEAVRVMASADAFVFPSLQEGWPTVVIEALSLGLPVVTTRQHGMADMIDETCGFPLRVDSPGQLIDDLASALRTLASDRDTLQSLSAGARRRAEHFSRDNQIRAIDALYREALEAAGGTTR
ncbi:MAG: glycosyltransferase family 4 protein [Planctomycetes bacterium]|nr:glycosyltransferase family 4 protein [Planctomycetota bacterium]